MEIFIQNVFIHSITVRRNKHIFIIIFSENKMITPLHTQVARVITYY